MQFLKAAKWGLAFMAVFCVSEIKAAPTVTPTSQPTVKSTSVFCTATKCKNGGRCSVGDTKCTCLAGFSGKTCTVVAPAPTPVPTQAPTTPAVFCTATKCKNGGRCSLGDTSCTCLAGFSGRTCTVTSAPTPAPTQAPTTAVPTQAPTTAPTALWCSTHTCLNGGACDEANDKCRCANNFTGKLCQTFCSVGRCSNGGICDEASHTCSCPPNWKGDYCQTPLWCDTHICQNGGTCNEEAEICECIGGYVGDYCQDFCSADRCHLNGFCDEAQDTCICKAGWGGRDCDTQLWCYTHKCQHGTCNEDTDTCDCDEHYGGLLCESFCASDPCQNGGQCSEFPDECSCSGPFTGTYCENFCSSTRCLNGGICHEDQDYCECTSSYYGAFCENEIWCQTHSCAHGTCDEANKKCVCDDFYSGTLCDTFCTTGRCKNGGFCVEYSPQIQSFGYCKCPSFYSGQFCEILPWCSTHTCLHNGSCSNGSQSCTCTSHYSGELCAVAPWCVTNTCLHNGTCNESSQTCTCTANYAGTLCADCSANFVGPSCNIPAIPHCQTHSTDYKTCVSCVGGNDGAYMLSFDHKKCLTKKVCDSYEVDNCNVGTIKDSYIQLCWACFGGTFDGCEIECPEAGSCVSVTLINTRVKTFADANTLTFFKASGNSVVDCHAGSTGSTCGGTNTFIAPACCTGDKCAGYPIC